MKVFLSYSGIICAFLLFLVARLDARQYSGHRWTSMPTFHANQTGTPDCAGEFTAVQSALQTWNAVTTSYANFQYGGTTSNTSVGTYDGTNLLMWVESGWTTLFPGYSGALALALTWYSGSTNLETDIAFNGQDHTWSDNGGAGAYDVQNIATHEIGHTISLGDLYGGGDTEKTMYGYASTGETKKRSLELSDEDALRYVYFDPTLSGTLSENQRWIPSLGGNTVTPTSNVTVPSGKTLTILPGVIVSPNGNYKLRVEGKLTADGNTSNKITFTRSGGQWYGIEFYYGQSGSSIQYAKIKNAQYGVSDYGTSAYLTNDSITNNSTGVYVNGAINSMNWNLFRDNTYGVQCANYGDANIQTNNVFRYNSWGVSGDYSSVPAVGSYIGYNSLYYNDYYDVYSDYGGTIYARGNWWGQYPPSPAVSENVDYSEALSVDPNTWAGSFAESPDKPKAGRSLQKSAMASPDTAGMIELNEAYRIYLNEDYERALDAFESITAQYSDAFPGARALVFADRILEKLGRDTRENLSSAIVRFPGTNASTTAKSLLTGRFLKEGKHQEALENAIALIDNSDKIIAKQALFDAGNIAWYFLNDRTSGEGYFRKLVTEYPTDVLSHSARATMGEANVAQEGQATTQVTDLSSSGFELQSHPNPFNPVTTISFVLKEPARVTIRIYDVLGRLVAEPLNEERGAGRQQILFDASAHPTGVYFYSLEAFGKSEINRFVLVK